MLQFAPKWSSRKQGKAVAALVEDFEIRIPQPGETYEHYKGGLYTVIAVGRLSEARDQIMVVYRSHERGHVWIRPLGMWSEYVELCAVRAQRFRRVIGEGP